MSIGEYLNIKEDSFTIQIGDYTCTQIKKWYYLHNPLTNHKIYNVDLSFNPLNYNEITHLLSSQLKIPIVIPTQEEFDKHTAFISGMIFEEMPTLEITYKGRIKYQEYLKREREFGVVKPNQYYIGYHKYYYGDMSLSGGSHWLNPDTYKIDLKHYPGVTADQLHNKDYHTKFSVADAIITEFGYDIGI